MLRQSAGNKIVQLMAFLRRGGHGRIGQLNFHEGGVDWWLRGGIGIGTNSGDIQRQIDNAEATQFHMCPSLPYGGTGMQPTATTATIMTWRYLCHQRGTA